MMEYPKDMLLPGRTYGKWCVIRYEGRDKKSNQLYLCCCECGFERIQRKSTLVDGQSVQCKNCRTDELNKLKDLVGQRIGNCIVLHKIESVRHEARYLVRCDCGIERKVLGYRLNAGNSTKCPHCRYFKKML